MICQDSITIKPQQCPEKNSEMIIKLRLQSAFTNHWSLIFLPAITGYQFNNLVIIGEKMSSPSALI